MTAPTSHGGHDHKLACVNLVPLFAGLSADDRRWVADVAVTRHYQRGEQVHRPGQRPALRIVHSGRVKVRRINESGAEQLLRILFPGDFHGETSLLTGRPVDSWAEALDPAEVCVLAADQVERLLRERPEVAMRMLSSVSARLADAEQQLSSITGASVARRLGEHLLRAGRGSGLGDVPAALDQEGPRLLPRDDPRDAEPTAGRAAGCRAGAARRQGPGRDP